MSVFPKTTSKFEEAQYFLERMIELKDKRDDFRYNFSAFVTAASSVISFLLNETNERNSDLNDWRTGEVENQKDEFQKIVYESRIQTVHKEPLNPITNVVVKSRPLAEPIEILPPQITFARADGTLEYSSAQVAHKPIPIYSYKGESTHFFEKNPDKNVITICGKHVGNLRDILNRCEEKYK